jgi:hypothetical protein
MDKISKLNLIKTWFYDDDILYSDEDEIKESGIFVMIDDIIDFIRSR